MTPQHIAPSVAREHARQSRAVVSATLHAIGDDLASRYAATLSVFIEGMSDEPEVVCAPGMPLSGPLAEAGPRIRSVREQIAALSRELHEIAKVFAPSKASPGSVWGRNVA